MNIKYKTRRRKQFYNLKYKTWEPHVEKTVKEVAVEDWRSPEEKRSPEKDDEVTLDRNYVDLHKDAGCGPASLQTYLSLAVSMEDLINVETEIHRVSFLY
jgi:hypothetical protein